MRTIHRGARLLGALSIIGLATLASAAGDPDVRTTMHELFAQVRIVLPLTLSNEKFADPAHRERIASALAVFEAKAQTLAAHGPEKDAGFAFQSDSLAQHAQSIARSFRRGETQTARFLLNRSLDDCVACHSKLPTAHEFPMGQLLLKEVDLASLSHRERARIQVVARQFEAALSSYEDLFAQPDAFASHRVSIEDWVAYFELCLTIENDSERATKTLQRLRKRADLPAWLTLSAPRWIHTIESLGAAPIEGAPLEKARVLLRKGEDLDEKTPRAGLVYQVEAWHELQRLVVAPGSDAAELGEAYYLLGVTESQMLRPFGGTAASPYLEAAIHTSPKQSARRQAFDLLEQLTILGYTGSSGTHVPPEVQRQLDTLKRDLESAR